MKKDCPIYTMDLETDGFRFGRQPKPFACNIFDGKIHKTFYKPYRSNRNIIEESIEYLKTIPPGLIYIHNGGKFDLFYYLEYLEGNSIFVIHNRIVSCKIAGHTVRDSYSIMPFPLSAYKKDEISYDLFEREVRDAHREKIVSYLQGDTEYLWTLCSRFVERFGPRLTIGGTSLLEMKKFHNVERLNENEDRLIRENYYYGGRVQCFEKGIVKSPLSCYDVNSMYPYVMQTLKHPVSRPILIGRRITRDTCFLTVTGENNGAFPTRSKNSGITFESRSGTYTITIHEWKTATSLNLFRTKTVNQTVDFDRRISFKKFITSFYNERQQAKVDHDPVTALFCKYILNSSYGKLAFNASNAYEYSIRPLDHILGAGWKPAFLYEGKFCIWKKHAWFAENLEKQCSMQDMMRLNVATAASITGGARAVLMEAIAKAKHPVYCDTDSIICESLDGVTISDDELGAWKLEKTGDRIAVAGKKLYAMFAGAECVKQASKGVKLSASEIERVAQGETVVYKQDSPSFSWDGTCKFITRKVRMT